jgi:hypothetical protein
MTAKDDMSKTSMALAAKQRPAANKIFYWNLPIPRRSIASSISISSTGTGMVLLLLLFALLLSEEEVSFGLGW